MSEPDRVRNENFACLFAMLAFVILSGTIILAIYLNSGR